MILFHRHLKEFALTILSERMSKKTAIYCYQHRKMVEKQNEIDIVGFNKNNNYIFAECKWKREKTDKDVSTFLGLIKWHQYMNQLQIITTFKKIKSFLVQLI